MNNEEILNTQLCTPSQLIEFTMCDASIKEEYLLRAIKLATDGDLSNCIGIPLLNSLRWLIYNNTLNEFQTILLNSFIRPLLYWVALKSATQDMSLKLNNAGLYGNQDNNKNTASFDTIQRMVRTYETNASAYRMRLLKVICEKNTEISDCIATVRNESNNAWWLQLDFHESKIKSLIL
jgi:hypothetical protein